MNLFKYIFIGALGLIVFLGCERQSTKLLPYNDISFYTHVEDSQFRGTPADEGVVQIQLQNSSGTGFFVSDDGIMMTNNHVVGTDECPQEGCFIAIVKNYQKGSEYESIDVFAMPLHTNPELDFSIYQLYETVDKDIEVEGRNPKSAPLKTKIKSDVKLKSEKYLKLASGDDSPNDGDTVYSIGHPGATLKKVTTLSVLEISGKNISLAGTFLPGQSGSPVINAKGEVVGIAKSSRYAFSGLSEKKLNATGLAVDIRAVVEVTNKIAPFTLAQKRKRVNRLHSLADPELSEDWLKNQYIYIHAKTLPPGQKDLSALIEDLASQCAKSVKELEDQLQSGDSTSIAKPSVKSCSFLSRSIACGSPDDDFDKDAELKTVFWPHLSCPSLEKRKVYSQYFQRIFDVEWLRDGDFSTYYLKIAAKLSESSFDDIFAEKLTKFNPAFSPSLVVPVMKLKHNLGVSHPIYADVDLMKWVEQYRNRKTFPYELSEITQGFFYYFKNKISTIDVANELKSLYQNDQVSLGMKLRIEEVLYQADLL